MKIGHLLLAGVAVTSFLAGCSTEEGDSSLDSAATEEARFDKDNVLTDKDLNDVSAMTKADVQKFFEHSPFDGKRSVLADYTPKGKVASELIVDVAKEFKINPLVLVVRLQLEHGLISKAKAETKELDAAFGCGCNDGAECSPEFVGFENQLRCAAVTLRRSMERLDGTRKDTNGTTLGGWKTGAEKETKDNVSVTPENNATATLYNYTPWVGELGGGKAKIGGVSAHWKLWNDFNSFLKSPDETKTSTSGNDTTSGNDKAKSGDDKAKSGDDKNQSTCRDADCGAGKVCGAEGTCVPGCRVRDGVDSCGDGKRCDHSDGLVGVCEAQACSCERGTFCDPSTTSPKCVQCTAVEKTNCRAEAQGSGCLPSGKCGCLSNADCGFGLNRTCDLATNTCVANSKGKSTGGQEDDWTKGGNKNGKDSKDGTVGSPSSGAGPEPAPSPDLPSSDDRRSSRDDESASSGDDNGENGSDDEADAGTAPKRAKKKKQSGCSVVAPGTEGVSGAWPLLLGLLLRRRKRNVSETR